MMLTLYLAAGFGLGAAYFGSMRWTTERLATGSGVSVTVAVVIGRFMLLGAVLALASRQGALPLLLMALGVFVARAAVLRRNQAGFA